MTKKKKDARRRKEVIIMLKKFKLEIFNENGLVEKHNTDDVKKCFKRIKMCDKSGNTYACYYGCTVQITDNATGRVLSEEETERALYF